MIFKKIFDHVRLQREGDKRERKRLRNDGYRINQGIKSKGMETPEIVHQRNLERKQFGEKGLVERITKRLERRFQEQLPIADELVRERYGLEKRGVTLDARTD